MKTRDRILDAARILYNQHGIGNVSIQDICDMVKISKGNFWYHFQNKEYGSKKVIVLELYQTMMEEMGALIETIPRNRASILYFLETHQQLFLVQSKYKFFFLNLFDILTNHEEVKKRYQSYRQMGEKLAHELLKLYIDKGVLTTKLRPREVDRLLSIGQILDSFWAIDAEIFFQGNEKQRLVHYLQVCCGLLVPYLTPAAQKEYHQFFENLETV
ncbi:MAG: TetR/AcrR family transcriptional regulator [Bacteroidota bacterium]